MENLAVITKIQSWMRMCLVRLTIHKAELCFKYQAEKIEKEIQNIFPSYVYINGTDYVIINGERVRLFENMLTTDEMFKIWSFEYKKQFVNTVENDHEFQEEKEFNQLEKDDQVFNEEYNHSSVENARKSTSPAESATELHLSDNINQPLAGLHRERMELIGTDTEDIDARNNYNYEELNDNKHTPATELEKKFPFVDIDWMAMLQREEARLEMEILNRIQTLQEFSSPHLSPSNEQRSALI